MGKWPITNAILFPGYIFMVSCKNNNLIAEVRKIPKLIKLPLYDREVEFLMKFRKKEHLIKTSYGYIENDKIIIADGTMKDYGGKCGDGDYCEEDLVL